LEIRDAESVCPAKASKNWFARLVGR